MSSSTFKNNKILAVDDDLKNLKLLQVRLKSVGYEVSTAENGLEGYEKARSIRPALIVSDLMMPKLDGIQFLEKIRADETLKDIGFILLTAKDTHESIIEGLSVGADDYIAKPFDMEELLARVKTNVRVSNLQEELKEKNSLLEEKIQELIVKDKKIQVDLDAAMVLQRALLPSDLPKNDVVEFAVRYQPTEKVGGDIYDVFEIDKHSMGILISDTSGHGVPAAFVSAMVKMAIINNERYVFSPVLLLQAINEQLCANIKTDYYLTMLYIVLNLRTKKMLFSKNSHPNAFLFKKNESRLEQLSTDEIKIGQDERAIFLEKEISLDKGDKVFLFTKGMSNCFAKIYGKTVYDKIQGVIKANIDMPIQRLVDTLYQETRVCLWDLPHGEDITILGMEMG